jgi:DNA-binding PadR family transcriptional regulator
LTEKPSTYISDFDNETQNGMKGREHGKGDQDFYGGLIRLHILHHASKGAVFGLWFIEELARHGYKLSPGTLYPLLHGLERKGYLRSMRERLGKQSRRMYRATPLGRKVLALARERVSELFGELLGDE